MLPDQSGGIGLEEVLATLMDMEVEEVVAQVIEETSRHVEVP